MWRRQLPAYSPLPLRAVLAGAMGLLTGGEHARASVAEALRATYGAKDVLLTDSGTGALTLAIRGCLADQPDALVALPAYGCYDLATAADGADARVLLHDVEPETLSPNLTAVRRALDRGARAIVLVHLYGVPADPHPIRALTGSLLLVLRTGVTNRELTLAKLDEVSRLPIRVLGAVLNDVRAAGHYRYYHYLPGYESEEEEDPKQAEWKRRLPAGKD